MDEGRPIFLQVAEMLEAQILDGSMPEGAQVPSINELAQFHRINPATALKGINLLVDQHTLYKRRGIGMFVADGARTRLLANRRAEFATLHLRPVVDRAKKIGLSAQELQTMIVKEMEQ
ncbi:GntR family transcriptional regulator [Demequina globuliformis]|uniref:GntR family transcriptional regulator n=1 Tax=Demequina globuliformis TaxID=676202 RepID=UPI000786310E|nr:GntR family transcriptional regulator [Demequina globuliformis]